VGRKMCTETTRPYGGEDRIICRRLLAVKRRPEYRRQCVQ
jgi:hypothetical protein